MKIWRLVRRLFNSLNDDDKIITMLFILFVIGFEYWNSESITFARGSAYIMTFGVIRLNHKIGKRDARLTNLEDNITRVYKIIEEQKGNLAQDSLRVKQMEDFFLAMGEEIIEKKRKQKENEFLGKDK